jgi:hypothetical protein
VSARRKRLGQGTWVETAEYRGCHTVGVVGNKPSVPEERSTNEEIGQLAGNFGGSE